MLIASKNGRDIAAVKAQLAGEFEMKDLGELKHFLGMNITRTNDRISIDQGGYIRQVLERYGMSNSKPVSTPLAPGARFTKTKTGDLGSNVDAKLYQGIVGSIMYGMLCTRPDLAFPIQQLSQFGSNPANAHFQAGKRATRYLQGTQTTGPIYNGEIKGPIQAYCDADYGAGEDRKSISGYIFLLAGAPISWQAKKQTTVAQSTVEAEYAAMALAAKEMIWLQHLLRDLGMPKYAPKTLFCDNQGAISLTKNPTHHAKTKHVDVQLHFIRDHVEKGTIDVKYCPTENMLADLMTKGLPRERHERLLGLMGVGSCEQTTTPSPDRRRMEITSGSEEFRNSHGGADAGAGTGTSYLCDSNCDMFNLSQ